MINRIVVFFLAVAVLGACAERGIGQKQGLAHWLVLVLGR